jgi:hypothetical protein
MCSRCQSSSARLLKESKDLAEKKLLGGLSLLVRELSAARDRSRYPPQGRPVVTFRLPVVSYFVSTSIWLYRLGRAANWARGSVANADVPLAYELASAFAFRVHTMYVFSLRNRNRSGRAYVGRILDD